MGVSGVSSAASAPTQGADATQKTNQNAELDKVEFLQLLVEQLKNQDPTNPMNADDFAAQLAQFTALEQMTKVAQYSMLSAALQMQGKLVTYAGPDGSLIEDKVESVSISGSKITLNTVSATLTLDQVLNVR